jgi:processive 1,2-diacylglycerol beta-glucosyltransferase
MLINGNGKILILSGRFGEGHNQVAKAIQEAVGIQFPDVETSVVDFVQWAYPKLFPISHRIYIKSIKTFPKLYGYIYKKTYDAGSFSKKINPLLLQGIGKMLTLLRTEKPSIVVSTFPFSSYLLSKLKELELTNVPLVTVITDHTHHNYWLHPCIDQYIVDSKNTKEELIRAGIPPEKVASTGIPIRTNFTQKSNCKELLEKYQVEPDLPTVLIMGGGEGLIGKGLLTNKTLNKIPYKLQFIIVCGHNCKLQEHLGNELYQSQHSIKLMGYMETVDELMAISDILVTKPGGVTTTEALAMKLPMLLYKPMPGQEQDNAHFLLNAGVAVQANNPKELVSQLLELLANKQYLSWMKQNAKNIQAEKAVFFALDIIKKFLTTEPLYTKDFIPKSKITELKKGTLSFLVNLIR